MAKKRHDNQYKVHIVLAIALVLVVLFNISQLSTMNTTIDERVVEAAAEAKAPVLQVVRLTTPGCSDCFDITSVVDSVRATGANITTESEVEFGTSEADKLIEKYGLERLPTVIVTGEYNQTRISGTEEVEDALVFTSQEPPFLDAQGDVRGQIASVMIKKDDCDDCIGLEQVLTGFESGGLAFASKEDVSADSVRGKNLIAAYGIEKLPALILDAEAAFYSTIGENWASLGTVEDDGSHVMQAFSPPYYSVEEDTVKGLVTAVFLEDDSCDTCYTPTEFHAPILVRLGVALVEQRTVLASSEEGQALIEEFELEKLPTILLSGDVAEYPALVNAWADVGDVVEGTYVFRRAEVARQPYKDLTTGEIVTS